MKTALHLLLATAALALLCPRAGATAANTGVSMFLFRDAPLNLVLKELQSRSGKKITVPAEVHAVECPCTIITGVPVSKDEIVAMLREYLEKQAGVVFDEQPDGSWLARLIARDRDPKTVGVIFKHVPARTALDTLGEWADDRKIAASTGVLKSTVLLDVTIFAAARGRAISLLCDALEKQADIVAKDLPDGTLQLRLKAGANDPIAPAIDFEDTPVQNVLSRLEDITGKQVWRRFNGSPTDTGSDREVLAGRSLTFHLEKTPTSQAYALLRAALEKQTDVLLEEMPDGVSITARLMPAAAEMAPRTLDFGPMGVHSVLDYLGAWAGKKIDAPSEVWGKTGDITLAFKAVPTKQAIILMRDALKQQAGIEVSETPDGKFAARLLPKTESFVAPADVLKR